MVLVLFFNLKIGIIGLVIKRGEILKRFTSHNLKETEKLGQMIAQQITNKDVICMTGDLGAGKTTLSQSIMKNLGIVESITSPTYTIVNEYHDPVKIFHFDVYRINDSDEMFEIGFDEYLDQEAVVIIEWANQIRDILPDEAIWIDIKYNEVEGQRVIEIEGLEALDENIEH